MRRRWRIRLGALALLGGLGLGLAGLTVPARAAEAPGATVPPAATASPAATAPAAAAESWLSLRMPAWLHHKLVLLEHWQWLALLALVLGGVILDRLVAVGFSLWLRRLVERWRLSVPEKIRANIARPIGLMVMAGAWHVLLPMLTLPAAAGGILGLAVKFLLAVGGVWTAYRCVDVLSAYGQAVALRTETRLDDLIIPMLRKALKVFITAFGLVFVAQNLNVNVGSLLAGLGLGGLAFALAAKDVVGNFFGSLTILIDRPFQIGDWIVIGETEGLVEAVGFRSTRVRTFYNSLVTVPNGMLVNVVVDNYGARTFRRIKTMLSVTYDTPPERIEAFCEGLRELIRRHPYTRKDLYHVYFNEYADASLGILLYCFVQTPDWATELRERHRLFVAIKRLAAKLGVEFAFPTQTIHVAGLPGPSAEAALAPRAEVAPAAAPLPATPSIEAARELGRRAAAELVAAELGEPARVPPPVSFAASEAGPAPPR